MAKAQQRLLDPNSIWQIMLSIGQDWTIQSVTNELNSVTGENWTRAGVSKVMKRHGLKEKWADLRKLGEGAAPETREIMDRVARRMKLEDLTNSTIALEAYNEAIIKAAEHLVTKIPTLRIEKASDFTAVMNALAVALQSQTTSRKELAEILSMLGAKTDKADDGNGLAPADATGGNVLSLRDKVKQAKG